MAFKGTAGKSSSGASMSKYDVEVESRLQALEKGLADCKAQCAANSHSHAAPAAVTTGSDPRVDQIIAHMAKNEDVSDLI
tara:strand:- start:330 stop:569 length:240 start_codon:yes stop_codon:yes gene_type:complete